MEKPDCYIALCVIYCPVSWRSRRSVDTGDWLHSFWCVRLLSYYHVSTRCVLCLRVLFPCGEPATRCPRCPVM